MNVTLILGSPEDNGLRLLDQIVAEEPSSTPFRHPEAGLHPEKAILVADEMIQIAKGGGRVVAATYSAEILRRLQRRVAEGVISSERVQIILLEDDARGGVGVKEIRLNEKGQGNFPLDFGNTGLNETEAHVKAIIARMRSEALSR